MLRIDCRFLEMPIFTNFFAPDFGFGRCHRRAGEENCRDQAPEDSDRDANPESAQRRITRQPSEPNPLTAGLAPAR